MNASALVDLPPAGLWSAGNIYLVFGRQVHLCVGDGARTVEVDGREVARGRKPLDEGHGEASGPIWERHAGVDLGWTVVAALAALLAFLKVRAGSAHRGGNG